MAKKPLFELPLLFNLDGPRSSNSCILGYDVGNTCELGRGVNNECSIGDYAGNQPCHHGFFPPPH